MPRVLTIEDDLVTAEEIATELRSHGFDVDLASDGGSGLALARAGDYAVITLDRMLPGIDGLALVTTLRREGITTPVLMISALSDVDERVRGLRAGGDDYLTKPFASDEMAARVEVLFQEVWGYHFDPGTNLIDVHIGRVRKRIEQPGRPQPIMTVRGTGYVFDAQS